MSDTVPKHKFDALVEELKAETARREVAEAKLKLVWTTTENVWHWQGGGDNPDSLICPVVMSPATLRELILARDTLASIDVPETRDFLRAVHLEAAHQRKRWPSEHDAGKTDADWFWLLGYLAGKALHNPGDDPEKQRHRIITVAAAAANWHAHTLGQTIMRPGIAEPR